MKIGILYICTGKYSIFWKDFYLSMEEKFISNAEKHYFVFTDNSEIDFEKDNPNIHRIYQENLGWPGNTLMRFDIFLKIEKELINMDYLFFFNANLLIEKEITEIEFIPTNNYNLLATVHPGFYNKSRDKFTYEINKNSSAYIPKNQGAYYFAGGLNGGKTLPFIEAMREMNNNIIIDKQKNIVALWHDESHWNKYLAERSDVKMISPSYLYPEGWDLPFELKILIRDKNKWGGHSLLRNEEVSKFKNTFNRIKSKIKEIIYFN